MKRWSEAVSAALRAALSIPSINREHVLVPGHSEGARFACRVAAMNPRVPYIASLAGGGPTRLFSLLELARSGALYADIYSDPSARVQKLLDDLEGCTAPARQHIRILPRPHLPCNGELQSVVLRRGFDAYKRANLILPKDLKTGQKRPLGFDMLLAELLAHGRDVVGDWIPGAGHGFRFPSEPNRDGQREVFERISTWFLQEKTN